MQTKDIFSEILNLKQGEVITIPCASIQEADKIRTSLYREKKLFSSVSPTLASSIVITREKHDNIYNVSCWISEVQGKVLKISTDGTVKDLNK